MSYQGYPYGQPQGAGQPPYPPPQGQYPPQGAPQYPYYGAPAGPYSGYPPPQGQYPPPQGQYPPQQGQYPPPQGQYPPPQGQYPPPQGQYPPPQGQYPPPQGQYPPPQGQYPPPQSPYPPGGQYQQPPPPQEMYAPPPPGSRPPPSGPPTANYPGPHGALPAAVPTAPSPGYGPPQIIQWDATPDAQALRSAMKGFGTDEKALIATLATKDPLQVETLKSTYSRLFNRNLINDIEKETGGWLEKGLVSIARGPLLSDVHLLRDSMSGLGTKEDVLNDVLLGRSNADIRAIKSEYERTFRRRLEDDVKSDLSMKTERHFLIVLGATRAEDSAPVVPERIEQDVQDLYRATEGKVGTDEIMVCSILSTRNDNQIRAIAFEYEKKFRRNLEEVIKKEFSGHMEDALLFQLRHAVDRYKHAASLLEDAMAGMGTKDHLLVSRVVRFHWNSGEMANIKGAYSQHYKGSLARRIKGETSGDYERLMVACIGG